MQMNKILRPSVWVYYADEQLIRDIGRGRFIGPWWMFRYSDEKVNLHFRAHRVETSHHFTSQSLMYIVPVLPFSPFLAHKRQVK